MSVRDRPLDLMSQEKRIPSPKVSVIIPAYNAASFLRRTILSALEQTAPPYEVIVVDDGSKDETSQIAGEFKGRVRWLSKVNGGPASARNYGVRVAEGDWIAFLDADDQWLPDKLEKQHELILDTGADMVSSDAILVRGPLFGMTWLHSTGIWARLEPFLGRNILPKPFEMLLTIGCFLLPSMVLVRKKSLMEAGLFDECMHGTEDIDLWLRLSLTCRIAVHPAALVRRQIHADNLSQNAPRMVAEQIKVWEKLKCHQNVTANPGWTKLVQKRAAEDYWHQGYWMLREHKLKEARRAWWKSLCASFSFRVAAHWLLTYFSDAIVYKIRDTLKFIRSTRSRMSNRE